MSKTYDDYAIYDTTIEEARRMIEPMIGFAFEQRDSSYFRYPYYHARGLGDETLELIINEDFEGESVDDDESLLAAIILHVERTERGDELRGRLLKRSNIVHLRGYVQR